MNWLVKNKNRLFLIVLLLLNWLILRPVLLPDTFFLAHDSTWVVRLQQFDKTVSLGQFPPRLAPDMAYGYGYPIFKYYAPLFTFLSWLVFKVIGDYALAVTLTVFLANLAGSWGMFLLGKKLYGFWGGIVSSVAFVFLPFRALDIYVRAAFAEILAINLLPLWLYFFILLSAKKFNKKALIGFVLTSAGLILSHNLYLIILACFLPLWLIYFLTADFPWKRKVLILASSALLVLLITAWFWLPLTLGLKDVGVLAQASKTNFSDHFVYLKQLWNWPWGFAGSAPGLADGMSFKLGKAHIILASLGLILAFLTKKNRRLFLLFLGLCLGGLFLSLSWSAPLWRAIPLLSTIQFPWRFLGLSAPILALLSGGVVLVGRLSFFNQVRKLPILVALLAVLGFSFFNFKYFHPQEVVPLAKEKLLDRETIYQSSQAVAEYYPVDVAVWPEEKPDWPLAFSGQQTAQVVVETPFKIIFRLSDPGRVAVNRFYFPGWQLSLEGAPVSITPEPITGRIQFQAEEPGEYRLSFVTTLWERVAYILTILGVMILIVVVVF